MATQRLNGAAVPFFLKVIADPAAFRRADAGMLLVARGDREAVLPAVRALYSRLFGHLEPATPASTKALAPGLGFAQGPGDGTSFGTSRCMIVAEALVAAHERGELSVDGRLRAVTSRVCPLRDRPRQSPPRTGAGPNADLDFPAIEPRPAARPPRRPSFLDIARAIGRCLSEHALWSRGRCTWVGPRQNIRPGLHPESSAAEVGPTLYDGTGGIALFLAELARVTGDAGAAQGALGAARQALERRGDVPPSERGGLFRGWNGIGVASAHVGRLLDAPELVECGTGLVVDAPEPVGDDVIDGRAGAVLGLVALAGATGDSAHREDAGRLARGLVEDADAGAWLRLVGAAHGLAGVVSAIDAAAWANGDAALASAADRLRAVLGARDSAGGISWCHGLAGVVGVLRGEHAQATLDRFGHELREHLAARHHDLSLCHGMLGAADALVEVADREPRLSQSLLDLAGRVGEVGQEVARDRRSWPCGVPGEPPGLMLGLSGIGLGYLRLHDPRVLSPLALGSYWQAASSRAGEYIKETV